MPTPVEMPKLGNTVEECLFSGWRKQKGDLVEKGRSVDTGRLGNCRYTEQLTVLLLGITDGTHYDEQIHELLGRGAPRAR
jgi:hypothetical protein